MSDQQSTPTERYKAAADMLKLPLSDFIFQIEDDELRKKLQAEFYRWIDKHV